MYVEYVYVYYKFYSLFIANNPLVHILLYFQCLQLIVIIIYSFFNQY